MEKVTTHAGLDVHMERIVIAVLEGQAREPTILDIPNDPKAIREPRPREPPLGRCGRGEAGRIFQQPTTSQ